MTAPRAIHFADPLPAPTLDQPAPERCIGAPPRRTTWELYEQQGISMGVWACEPGAWKIAFHAHRHEFFQVLEEGGCSSLPTAAKCGNTGPAMRPSFPPASAACSR